VLFEQVAILVFFVALSVLLLGVTLVPLVLSGTAASNSFARVD